MDNITYCAQEAKRLGISYGKYMALYGKTDEQIEREQKEAERRAEEEKANRDITLACVICGNYFKVAINKGQKYCSDKCRCVGSSQLALKRYYKNKGMKEEENSIALRKQQKVVIPRGHVAVPEGYVARNCKQCGEEFAVKEGRKNKIYCSDRCRRRAAKQLCYAKKARLKESEISI